MFALMMKSKKKERKKERKKEEGVGQNKQTNKKIVIVCLGKQSPHQKSELTMITRPANCKRRQKIQTKETQKETK